MIHGQANHHIMVPSTNVSQEYCVGLLPDWVR
jgi:hypothetical protein